MISRRVAFLPLAGLAAVLGVAAVVPSHCLSVLAQVLLDPDRFKL